MKSRIFIWIALIGMFAGLIIINQFKTGNSIKENVDVFEGTITNMNLEPALLSGKGVYDRSCFPVENGLTQCDAGIQTENGLLNFNYKHNMDMQGCLDKGNKLNVEILAGNKARVTRL